MLSCHPSLPVSCAFCLQATVAHKCHPPPRHDHHYPFSPRQQAGSSLAALAGAVQPGRGCCLLGARLLPPLSWCSPSLGESCSSQCLSNYHRHICLVCLSAFLAPSPAPPSSSTPASLPSSS